MKVSNKIKSLFIGLAVIAIVPSAKAQYIEDAVRFSNSNGYPTARTAGLGISYIGLVDDFGAIYYNPAGLALIPKTEITAGLDFLVNSTVSKDFNINTKFRSNDENLNNLGIVSPFSFGDNQDKRGAIAIGYFKESNYTQDIKSDWFNPNSSYAASLDPAVAYHVWLSRNSISKTNPIDSMQQHNEIYQSGGMHNFTGAVAFDINKNVSLGFSIVGKWGTYDYTREITETDTYNAQSIRDDANYATTDLNELTAKESLTQKIHGISGSVGLLGKIGNNIRLSIAVKFPTYFEIDETSKLQVGTKFDDGYKPNDYISPDINISYKIRTPFVYNGGISFYANGLTFSAGLEYKDASQLEYTDVSLGDDATSNNTATTYRDNLNQLITSEIVGQVTWGFGAEYNLPLLPLAVRASYTSTTSPYALDVSGANKTTLALGAGYSISKGVRLDFVMMFGDYTEFRTNYGSDISSRYTVNIKPTNIGLNLTMRI